MNLSVCLFVCSSNNHSVYTTLFFCLFVQLPRPWPWPWFPCPPPIPGQFVLQSRTRKIDKQVKLSLTAGNCFELSAVYHRIVNRTITTDCVCAWQFDSVFETWCNHVVYT